MRLIYVVLLCAGHRPVLYLVCDAFICVVFVLRQRLAKRPHTDSNLINKSSKPVQFFMRIQTLEYSDTILLRLRSHEFYGTNEVQKDTSVPCKP